MKQHLLQVNEQCMTKSTRFGILIKNNNTTHQKEFLLKYAPMLVCNTINKRSLDRALELRRKLPPVSGDLLTEENSGELSYIGGLANTQMFD